MSNWWKLLIGSVITYAVLSVVYGLALYPREWTGAFKWEDALWVARTSAAFTTGLTASHLLVGYRRKEIAAERATWFNDPLPQATKKPSVRRSYCANCGKLFESRRIMLGYDTKTGKPTYTFERACPDSTPGDRQYPQCSSVAGYSAPQPGQHNHDGTDVVVTCAVCIDGMVRDGVLTVEAAEPLYAKAGASIPSVDNSALSGWFASMSGPSPNPYTSLGPATYPLGRARSSGKINIAPPKP